MQHLKIQVILFSLVSIFILSGCIDIFIQQGDCPTMYGWEMTKISNIPPSTDLLINMSKNQASSLPTIYQGLLELSTNSSAMNYNRFNVSYQEWEQLRYQLSKFIVNNTDSTHFYIIYEDLILELWFYMVVC